MVLHGCNLLVRTRTGARWNFYTQQLSHESCVGHYQHKVRSPSVSVASYSLSQVGTTTHVLYQGVKWIIKSSLPVLNSRTRRRMSSIVNKGFYRDIGDSWRIGMEDISTKVSCHPEVALLLRGYGLKSIQCYYKSSILPIEIHALVSLQDYRLQSP